MTVGVKFMATMEAVKFQRRYAEMKVGFGNDMHCGYEDGSYGIRKGTGP